MAAGPTQATTASFLVGANLPWLSYGGDFGANAWRPHGGLSTRDLGALDRTLATARAAGAEVVRWFVFCDGRAGFTVGQDGRPIALQEVVLDDMRAALGALGRHDLRMVPVLFDFTWADPTRVVNGVQTGGRGPVLQDAMARHQLLRAVDTLLLAFADHPGIALWDLCNEPEWLSAPFRRGATRLSPRRVRQWLSELTLHVRWHATQPITVGLASACGLPLCRDLGLDLLQVHWYDHLDARAPLDVLPRVPWSEAPLLLGEFPSRGSAQAAELLLRRARAAGFSGAWAWSLLAEDSASDGEAVLRALRSITGGSTLAVHR